MIEAYSASPISDINEPLSGFAICEGSLSGGS